MSAVDSAQSADLLSIISAPVIPPAEHFSAREIPEPLLYAPRSRLMVDPAVAPSELAAIVCRRMLDSAGVKAEEIDLLIGCSQTPDLNNPGLANMTLARLGLAGIPGLELRHFACGAAYALDAARQLIESGIYRRILVCSCELLSRYFPEADPAQNSPVGDPLTAQIFGDGAAACLVSAASLAPVRGIALRVVAHAAGVSHRAPHTVGCDRPSSSTFPLRLSAADLAAGRHLPRVLPALFLEEFNAELARAFEDLLEDADLSRGDLRAVLSHELFGGMNDTLAELLRLDAGIIEDCFAGHGHIGSAGLLVNLAQFLSDEQVGRGDRIGLIALSSGATWSLSVLEVR